VRTIFPHGAVRFVLRGPIRGARYEVAPGMGMTYALGAAAYGHLEFARLVKPGMTVYDIGANRGQMALLFARQVGPSGAVMCFEPLPELCQKLERNLALNGIRNVSVQCLALADVSETRVFLYHPDRSTQGKLADVERSYSASDAQEVRVQTASIDELIAGGMSPPDFMKVDVEGAGAVLLQGASNTLRQYRPTIYIELHGPEEQAAVRDRLLPIGYRLETLDGRHIADPTAAWASPLICRAAVPRT
jgi:FkbM family methyltransferase